MDIFALRDRLVGSYLTYVRSFINIQDEKIRGVVDEGFESGVLSPDPLIQLNPSFQNGDTIEALVGQGVLHDECNRVFRIKPDPDVVGDPLQPYQHQVDAILAAESEENYVLTTGTGSGKSLAYIVPIVNHVLRNGSGKGIQAIVVYPMNALANSQLGELDKFLKHGYPDGRGPVTFARYTGQESREERDQIKANPPDILLTNYVMLELITTRPDDQALIRHAQGLQFLVMDELHTYRGRQGADVAMLVRRVRDLLNANNLQCVGTSATLAGPGTYAQQQAQVSEMASLLFGSPVRPERVIGETLERSTADLDFDDPRNRQQLAERIRSSTAVSFSDDEAFRNDPLNSWIETTFGVEFDAVSNRLKRSTPRPLRGEDGAAVLLADLTGVDENTCARAIERALLADYDAADPDSLPPFAFRLHQFISPADTVYASLEPEKDRYLTLVGQQFMPGHREKILLPLVFCRECGQDYYGVYRQRGSDSNVSYLPREYLDRDTDDDSDAGFLYYSSTKPWTGEADAIEEGRVPDAWIEEVNGDQRVSRNMRRNLPGTVVVRPDGSETMVGEGLECQFIEAPFRFCLNCGIEYAGTQRSDFSKLASLGTEGRSTATTILTLSAIRQLQAEESLPERARKLLSFSDNRQDASLQAGHFNDFIEIGLLRGALYKAVADAGEGGIHYTELTERVFNALSLEPNQYAVDPNVRFAAKTETERALRDVLGYRLYRDLKRGWRVTLPNLEQCGLLEIRYESIDDIAAAADIWQDVHPALLNASPDTRRQIATTLLDYMRRELAIKVDYLDSYTHDRIKAASSQRLIAPWAIDEHENMDEAFVLKPRRRQRGDYRGYIYLSGFSAFGRYLRRSTTFPDFHQRLATIDGEAIIGDLLEALREGGLVEQVIEPDGDGDVPGYQLPASAMRWVAGDGTRSFRDPVRVPTEGKSGTATNDYFVDYYQNQALGNIGIHAREHTAQVPYEQRLEREDEFREGRLPLLFCSPTMELGVDISQLNVVNMRNVPPTPANYAQRSGRAGRSGQPALVFNYCSVGSPHDQFFFRRPYLMVSGAVAPPRLDLTNEDLIQSHVQAVWLTETGQSLGQSLADLLDLSGDPPSLELKPDVTMGIENPQADQRARDRAERILATITPQLATADWYSNDWLDTRFNGMINQFNQAADRWRDLYQAALSQAQTQTKIIHDATRLKKDKDQATRLRREAEAQLSLLTSNDQRVMQSDFYSYRYFASEGFLPGYSFPRLPLSAFIPGRRMRGHERDEFLQRPRFLAVSEFGPRAIVYHEGSRYEINQVILPVGDHDDILTTTMKRCRHCGYLHESVNGVGPDLCQRCDKPLDDTLTQLFRLQNVSTRRRDRISSDEEERLRLGYELRTGFRFATREGRPSYRSATVLVDGESTAALTYGDTATLWRINLGWRRRKNADHRGFVLDIERGYWGSKNEQAGDEGDAEPKSQRQRRVIPYVEDRRNCLIIEPATPLSPVQMASLQAALKNAIQVVFQLEDNELATEPLPDVDNRKLLLLYESAEGGAGVLRRVLDDPNALSEVARAALDICHYDQEGTDQLRGKTMREDCEAACYDCLMSYANQRDHALLDRKAIRDVLLELARATVDASPTSLPPDEHYQQLLNMCQSSLEREWLQYARTHGYRLPDVAQKLIESAGTQPDFTYRGDYWAAIYIDGPFHAFPERQARDREVDELLSNEGYEVIRFGWDEAWETTFSKHPHLFGERQ